MTPVLSEGSPNFWLENPTIRRRFDGLDELSAVYFTDNPLTIAPGESLPSPYQDFKARDVEVNFEPDGTAELRVTGIGIYGTQTNRKLGSSWTENQEGFDDGTETWLVLATALFVIGTASTEQEGMYVSDVSFERVDPDFNYYRANVKYRGILRNKDQKIHLSTAAREIGIENIAVRLPGGWDDPRSGDILWPRPEVRTSYVQVGAPGMADIPSTASPPIDPGVWIPQISGDLKWHFPNGWVIVAREAENLNGTTLWFVQETYMWNSEATY
jgi:hypothetical protein